MYEGIRTMSGIRFLMAEMATLEHTSTNIVASPMPMPLMADEVVPSVGHMPNKSTKVGFSRTIPFISTFMLFIINPPLYDVLHAAKPPWPRQPFLVPRKLHRLH